MDGIILLAFRKKKKKKKGYNKGENPVCEYKLPKWRKCCGYSESWRKCQNKKKCKCFEIWKIKLTCWIKIWLPGQIWTWGPFLLQVRLCFTVPATHVLWQQPIRCLDNQPPTEHQSVPIRAVSFFFFFCQFYWFSFHYTTVHISTHGQIPSSGTFPVDTTGRTD